MLHDLRFRIRDLFRRGAVERELDDELRFHLDRHVEKLVAKGQSREQAERQARVAIGGVEQVREECRSARGVALFQSLFQDVAFAVRLLRKRPGFTVSVALSLALGIGANTAIFTLIDAVMWRTLPVRDPAGLMLVTRGRGTSFSGGFTYQQYRAMREEYGAANIAAWSTTRLNVGIDGSLEPTTDGQLVSGSYFSLLGVHPRAGRGISAEDDVTPNGHPVAMISYGYWKRRFALAPSTIGRSISISGAPFTIIGVTPPEFSGIEVGTAPDIFLPLMMQPAAMPDSENLLDRPIVFRTWLQVITRLQPGVTAAQAAASLRPPFLQETPNRDKTPDSQRDTIALESAATGISNLRRQFLTPLVILMGIVTIVLLIACANTANLLLARSAARRPEFAMRIALGAGRRRLIRQLLVESVVLATLGGMSGVLLAMFATRLLVAYLSAGRSPISLELSPNLHVLSFTFMVSCVTGILFGLAPALRTTRVDLSATLTSAGRSLAGRLRFGKVLCVTQVALCLVLLIVAGLFVRSLQKLSGQDSGVDRDRVLIVRVEPKGSDQRNIPGTSARLHHLYRELLEDVRSIPGVSSASLAQFTPSTIRGNSVTFRPPSGEEQRAVIPIIYPDYFATMGISLVDGRDFNEADLAENSPLVVVVNETFAARAFGRQSPVGQQLRHRDDLREVIGVVRDSRYANLRGDTQPVVYQPFLQTNTGRGQMALYVRTHIASQAILPRIREAVQNVDRTLPLFAIRTLDEELDAAMVQERVIAMLSAVFGTLALLLACVGLYGILAFSVVQRTSEMGLRLALGATRSSVVWDVMREGLLLVAIGVAIGVPVAVALARLASNQISGLLFGLTPTDPLTIAAATLVLAVIGACAGCFPALRASRVDPLVALRTE